MWQWHEKLAEVLWAYRMSYHWGNQNTPYRSVYGQDIILPWEVSIDKKSDIPE